MRTPSLALAFVLALAAPPTGAVAQPLRAGLARGSGPPPTLEPAEGRSIPALAGAGLLGGALGLVAGAYVGATLADDDAEGFSALGGAVAGGAIGEALLLPLGVHLAGGRRGSYAASVAASLGLVGAGLLALEAVHYDSPGVPIVVVAVPLAQLVTAVAIERGTGERERP